MLGLQLHFLGPGVVNPFQLFHILHVLVVPTPYLLSISPMYTFGQSFHGMEYTTPAESWADHLSLGCKSCLKVLCSFVDVATLCLLKVLYKASEIPFTYDIVTIDLVYT